MKGRRSPGLAATTPGIAKAAVWVGLGARRAVSGIGWRPGAAGVEKPYLNSIKLKIPTMITMLTQAYSRIRINSFCMRYIWAFSSNEEDTVVLFA